LKYRTAAEAALEPSSPAARRVGWGFISLYTLAYMSTSLLFLAPVPVTLALKVDSLVGIKRAPASLALVAGIGALVALFGNPFFGRMSDRTASRLGMRRPWMVTGLAGGSLGILIVALAPSIPVVLLGWCIAQLFFNALLAAMVAVLPDQVPSVQRGQVSGVLGVSQPVASVCGAFLVKLFTGSLLAMFRTGRRKIFVLAASVVYGLALFVIAVASNFSGFLVGMAISGLGFGVYAAVDLALVVDVLPDKRNAAKDLGVFNIAGALPFSIAPAIAPAILVIGGGSYGVLYMVAGLCAIIGAFAILPVRRVR